jgi:hypothetical protein
LPIANFQFTAVLQCCHSNCNSGNFRGGCWEIHHYPPTYRFPHRDAIPTSNVVKPLATSDQQTRTKCRTEINLFNVGNELVSADSILEKTSLNLLLETRRLCHTAITISSRMCGSNAVKTVIIFREIFNESQYRIDYP